MDNPRSGLSWLDPRKGRTGGAGDLLRRLGRGEIELTHEAFHGLQPGRAAAHLRELLMACGVLPAGAEAAPLKPCARSYAGDQIKHATSFLRWLDEHDLTVST